MTDPTGPPPAGRNQGGWSTAGAPGGDATGAGNGDAEHSETPRYPGAGGNPGAGGYAETALHPGAEQHPAPQYPGQQYPGPQYAGPQYAGPQYPAEQYPETAHYPAGGLPGGPYPPYGAGPHPGEPYPGAAGPYGTTPHPGPAGWNPAYGGAPAPGPRRRRTGIIVAAVVASVAIVAAVVVVVLLNRAPDPDTPVARGASTAALAIPDNTPGGATSTITLDGDATAGRIDVVLDLQHRFPREVTAVLTSPAGRQAVVFPRSDTAGRVTLSTTQPSSPLLNLQGGPVAGDWALTLSDEVGADAGTLNSWEVVVYPAAADAPAPSAAPVTGSSAPGLAIPDQDELIGVTDVVALGGYGTVDRVAVDVTVAHGISSDLRVELRSPLGRSVVLTDREVGLSSGGTIALSLDSSAPGSPLAPLVGEPLAGPWQLRVLDAVAVDTGTLQSWSVTVNG